MFKNEYFLTNVSKILEVIMQFRNICKVKAQKLLLYQILCCSEHNDGLHDTVSKYFFEYWGLH